MINKWKWSFPPSFDKSDGQYFKLWMIIQLHVSFDVLMVAGNHTQPVESHFPVNHEQRSTALISAADVSIRLL